MFKYDRIKTIQNSIGTAPPGKGQIGNQRYDVTGLIKALSFLFLPFLLFATVFHNWLITTIYLCICAPLQPPLDQRPTKINH